MWLHVTNARKVTMFCIQWAGTLLVCRQKMQHATAKPTRPNGPTKISKICARNWCVWLLQWFLKITSYADELLKALGTLDRWPEKVRLMQENWIGKSAGAKLKFKLAKGRGEIEVFTTRPDTLYGASFVAISPNHPLAAQLA